MIQLLLATFFSFSVFANVFTTDSARTVLDFQGNVIKRGVNDRSAAALIRPNGKQTLRIVLEVKDFQFATDFEYNEFNDEFLESHYFPQIRFTGELPPSVNTDRTGTYQAMVEGTLTIRQISRKKIIPVNLTIRENEALVEFSETINLSDFNIPYAGPGSDIGSSGLMKFSGTLKKTQR